MYDAIVSALSLRRFRHRTAAGAQGYRFCCSIAHFPQ